LLAAGDGAEAGDIATPLSHCNFLPTLTQVNFFPVEIDVCPALAHVDPVLIAEKPDSALRIENVIIRQVTAAILILG
jgi:hypothetical protein